MSYISVAIDGPAGAGKSSIAKAVAKKLGFIYVDTGALYRSIAFCAIKAGIDIKSNPDDAASLAEKCTLDILYKDSVQHILVDGVDVTDYIRTPEVSKGASDVSAIPRVRAALLNIQRSLAEKNSVIMDGRDIGTVVLPNADIKIFLTASVDERAKRRYKEMLEKGVECNLEDIKKDISYRDLQDSTRETAPLKPAEDSVYVDNSDITFEESVERVLDIISPFI